MESRNRKIVRSTLPRPRAAGATAPRRARVVVPASLSDEALALAGIDEAALTPQLRQTLLSLMAEKDELRAQLHETRSRIASLEKLVDEDPLMPVCNRRAFVRELSRMMALAGRYGLPGSVVYFDVNNLKHINDAYGHAAGDAALMQVARVLVESVRTTDVVGRLGGDELGVLLIRTDKVVAESKATELAAHIGQRPLLWQGQSIPLSVAFGVYAFLGNEKPHDVLDAADREMYRHKTGRRNGA
jgi:diguanylate cyclase (GGDEF)-like protein